MCKPLPIHWTMTLLNHKNNFKEHTNVKQVQFIKFNTVGSEEFGKTHFSQLDLSQLPFVLPLDG